MRVAVERPAGAKGQQHHLRPFRERVDEGVCRRKLSPLWTHAARASLYQDVRLLEVEANPLFDRPSNSRVRLKSHVYVRLDVQSLIDVGVPFDSIRIAPEDDTADLRSARAEDEHDPPVRPAWSQALQLAAHGGAHRSP